MRWPSDGLFELEWRAYRTYLPNTPRRLLYWAAPVLAVLIASQLFLRERGTLESHFVLGFSVALLFGGFLSSAPILTLWESPFKDWWLTLPRDRRDLVRAKALATMRLQLHFAGCFWLVCTLDALLRAGAGALPDEPSAGRILADIAAYGCLMAATAPLTASTGYMLMGMNSGWRRWLLLPFCLLFFPPFALIALVTDPEIDASRWTGAGPAALLALLLLALSALLYRSMLTLVTRYGLPELARFRSGGATGMLTASSGIATPRRTPFRARRTGFAALVAFERSRFRQFASHRIVRAGYAVVLALAAIGGYVAAGGGSEGMTETLQVMWLLAALAPGPIQSTVTQWEANRRRLAWHLALPYGRRQLLGARLLAVWLSWSKWCCGALAAYAAGIGARAAANGPIAWPDAREQHQLMFAMTIFLLAGLLISFLMLAQPLAFRSKIAATLIYPLTSAVYYVPMWLRDRIDGWMQGVSFTPPFWFWSALALLAAALLAYLSIAAGARWMHLYLLNTNDMVQRRRAAGMK